LDAINGATVDPLVDLFNDGMSFQAEIGKDFSRGDCLIAGRKPPWPSGIPDSLDQPKATTNTDSLVQTLSPLVSSL